MSTGPAGAPSAPDVPLESPGTATLHDASGFFAAQRAGRPPNSGRMPRASRLWSPGLPSLTRARHGRAECRGEQLGWLRRPAHATFTLDELSMGEPDLRAEVLRLRRRVEKLRALARILVATIHAFGIDLGRHRVPDGDSKAALLRAVQRGQIVLGLRKSLAVIGLSPSRFHAWKRTAKGCQLDDHSSCPKVSPHRVTSREIQTMKEMVTSPEYRHAPTGTLAILAQRLGRVFASATTWRRLVRERGWRRPRVRVHPVKPKVGIRAEKPDEIWHIDTTLIRLVDGTKAYVHAVIDNFSRRILSWRVAGTFDPGNTVTVLLEACRSSMSQDADPPTVVADGGVENVNGSVDELIGSGLLRRVLAMTELRFSNSMIEAWWRALKHQWLFLNTLDSVETVRKLVSFYVAEHNQRLPHSAFRGQTPDEIYFGRGAGVPDELESARKDARRNRLELNRALSCAVCEASHDTDAA